MDEAPGVRKERLHILKKNDRILRKSRRTVRLNVHSQDDDLEQWSELNTTISDSSPLPVPSLSESSVDPQQESAWLKGLIDELPEDDETFGAKREPSPRNSEEELELDDASKSPKFVWKHCLKAWSTLGSVADIQPLTIDGKTTAVVRRLLNATNSLNAYRKRLLRELKEQVEDSLYAEETYAIYSILRTMMGYVNEQTLNFDDAIYAYSEGSLMSQRRIMRCLAQKFARCRFSAKLGQNSLPFIGKQSEFVSICSSEDVETFLVWAVGCGEIIKLQVLNE